MTDHGAELRAMAAERGMRDLISLLSISALWIHRDGEVILDQMLDAVQRLVPLRLAFIEVPILDGKAPTFVGRIDGAPVSLPEQAAWRTAASQWQSSSAIHSATATSNHTPLGPMRIVRLDLGLSSMAGRVWFGADAAGFPSMPHLAVLRAAVSLAAMGLQAARSRHEREQAYQAKDEFLAMLGHELRNPLAPIRSGATLLQLDGISLQQVKKTGDVIERQVRHMTALVDDLLDVSRLARGSIVLEQKIIGVRGVLEQAVEQLRPTMTGKWHALNLDFGNEEVYVKGDVNRLVQVLANLLSNAAKFTPHGGRISVTLLAAETAVQITVTDNGQGIEPGMLDDIFGLFVQAHRAPGRAEGGLGVGLALAKRLVELHGGSIHASSEGCGQGATFTVILPRVAGVEQQRPGACTDQLMVRYPMKVLIVDDNRDAAEVLAAMLRAIGHDATSAYHPQAALTVAQSEQFDVFVLDIGLPDMDGYELARHLAAHGATPENLVALTGFGQPEDRLAAHNAGFGHHCVKPVDIISLNAVLAKIGRAAAERASQR